MFQLWPVQCLKMHGKETVCIPSGLADSFIILFLIAIIRYSWCSKNLVNNTDRDPMSPNLIHELIPFETDNGRSSCKSFFLR